MKEQNELNESMIRDAMQGCKLDSKRSDAILENIRGKRSESAARGRRRHMEKIIAAYVGVAAVFVLSITVGTGLWTKFASSAQPEDPVDTAGTQINHPAAENTIWSDREGVNEFVERLNAGGGREYDPMNRLTSVRDQLDYQYDSTYSAENILRIHTAALEGQDEFAVFQQYGADPMAWVLLNGETIIPLMEWSPYDGIPQRGREGWQPLYSAYIPLAFYDITLAEPRGDGTRDLLVMAYSKRVVYCVNWHSDDTKEYYFEEENHHFVWAFQLNPETTNQRMINASLVSSYDYETGVYDNPYCVFGQTSASGQRIDVLYAQSTPPISVTGEFAYKYDIGDRYGYLEYHGSGGEWNSDYWQFVVLPDSEPPESDPVTPPESGEYPYEVNVSGLLLRLNITGDAYNVVGTRSAPPRNITIPESCNGLPVTGIWDSALTNGNITSVTIPESVTWIGQNAFYGSGITEITIPSSVISINANPFGRCENLERIIVAPGNPVYHAEGNCLIDTEQKTLVTGCKNSKIPTDGSVTKIGDRAFNGLFNLTSVEIPDCVTAIGSNAFSSCHYLTEIVIPEGVIEIGSDAFTYCRNLKSITIPASVTAIGESAFSYCPELTDIKVAKGNPAYISIGDGLIEIQSKTLIVGSKDGSIPADGSVERIGKSAFGGFNFTEVIIPDTVTSIDEGAFINCEFLRRILIPGSVTSIGRTMFFGCERLTDIYYAGTQKQWERIQIGTFNEEIFAANLHYGYMRFPELPATPEKEVVTSQGIVLRLSETGDSYYVYSFGRSTSIHIVIPASWGGLPVTEIGDGAFQYSGWMQSVTIPDSVTRIGRNAFEYCSLTSITLPDSLEIIEWSAFASSKLKSVTLPKGLNKVCAYAFSDCKDLTSVNILCRTVTIEYHAFLGCDALTDVYYIGSEKEWNQLEDLINNEILTSAENIRFGSEAPATVPEPTLPAEPDVPPEPDVPTVPAVEVENEQGLLLQLSDSGEYYRVVGIGSFKDSDLVIPTSFAGLPVTMISSFAFDGCEGLVSVTIPEGILEIGTGAFRKIESLTSVSIPSTVRTVGGSAFQGCVNLQSVNISKGVLRYGDQAFLGCRSLKTITIPKGAEFIGEWIFDECDSLTDVYYGGSREEWEYAAFDVMPPDHATLHFGE